MRRLAAMLAAALILFALSALVRGENERTVEPARADSSDDVAYAVHWWHEWHRRARIRGKVIRKLRARLRERDDAGAAVSRSPSHAGRFLATCYHLSGRTKTGRPAGPGVIAVDPSVIPLGSRVSVSDYGAAIAADTGGAIKGHRIDEWRSSCTGYPNPMVTVRW